jgi:hypothetical protein
VISTKVINHCIHCDPTFIPDGPDDYCYCLCHRSEFEDPPQASFTPLDKAVRDAAHEIVERWFTNDLPDRARTFSSTPQQLRVLILDVLSRRFPPLQR